MASRSHEPEPKNFAPKVPVQLDPPKDDTFTESALSEYTGSRPDKKTYVAIKGVVFDVTGNESYAAEKGPYRVFAGKDASRALAMSSVKPEDCISRWEDLPAKEKTVLDEWMTFFTKRYNIVGKVVLHS